ncbi:MAG: HAMP domain-containing protein [Planctomycetes bacterium]|nr:HAMP domain-containing protein [Planctomycetota bacterium]
MLFRRTLRRKMMLGLALVLVMLVTLSLSGISGLSSYRDAVHDLDFSINKAPRTGDLLEAIGLVFEPLLWPLPEQIAGAELQRRELQKQLAASRRGIAEFRSKLQRLPPTEAYRAREPLTAALLGDIDQQLAEVQRLEPLVEDFEQREAALAAMRQLAMKAQALAQRIPDYQSGLNRTLLKARDVYRSRVWLVCVTSAIALFLFLGLVRSGYVGIFAPLRELHQGACRVAQGDFDYRIALPSDDEMGELAASFNKMTARFQEIACDLDRQVCERSKQLVRSERLAGIGFLAAGVAHEINNPLSAIAMAAESLESRSETLLAGATADEAAVARQYLAMIVSESYRCRQITGRLLDFARGQDATRSHADLTLIVSEVLAMIRPMRKYRDRTIVFERTAPCYVEVNGPEIKQVVLNLAANALESIDDEGALRIEIEEQTDQVCLAFEDDGCGMSGDTIEHLFEPFFTRRRDGKGTGLGLAISHRIIEDHGGAIEAASAGPGQGSTFRVYLPRRAEAARAA